MFGWKKKDKNKEKEAKEQKPVREPYLKLVRRVDVQEESTSEGDGEYYDHDTLNCEVLDIVRCKGEYYAVLTLTYYSSTYDRYESPMNRSSERSSFEIHKISEELLNADKDAILENMKTTEAIFGSCQEAPSWSSPQESFVEEYAARALLDHEAKLRAAEAKKAGKAKPNAVEIPASGRAKAIYIDDFSSRGLARALDCDEVKVFEWDENEDVAYFYDAKVVFGRPYNAAASSVFEATLEGTVIACGRNDDGSCAPFDEESAKLIANLFNVKKSM